MHPCTLIHPRLLDKPVLYKGNIGFLFHAALPFPISPSPHSPQACCPPNLIFSLLIAFPLFSTYHISPLSKTSPTHFKEIPFANFLLAFMVFCCISSFLYFIVTSITRIAGTEPMLFKLTWVLLFNIINPQNWPFKLFFF